jgi:prepilin-type N-terminal cleavage/methylation domain-containing protein
MLARIRKAQEEREGGFTLIELLVVIIIIGILAAIAIPVFLNQRKKAVDTSMKSDLRTVANEEETYFTDNQNYIAVASANPAVVGTTNVQLSNGNLISVIINASGSAYCELATRAAGKQPGTQDWVYISNQGGLQPAGTTACPAAAAF